MNQFNNKQKRWQRINRLWAESGLSQAEFCRKNNYKLSTFHYYRKAIKDNNFSQFAKIVLMDSPTLNTHAMRLHYRDFAIEITTDFNATILKDVLSVLKGV